MTNKKDPIILPRKPSALLRIAVADSRAVAKMKTRKLDMLDWHAPYGGVCSMCMAGAVMDRTLHADPRKPLTPSRMGENDGALMAIDALRTGSLTRAVHYLQLRVDAGVAESFRQMIQEKLSIENLRAPWSVYLRAAAFLEEHGL